MAATGPIPDLRRQFDAIMWRFRVSIPWRDVPERYGNWSTSSSSGYRFRARAAHDRPAALRPFRRRPHRAGRRPGRAAGAPA
ncbi:transposase [Kitasatospora sp. NBC_01302]|uniref:transposase n=1 Tax=Kitasatospora sp. NBC_01302 TaxID=2903575 RepID=UPI003FA3C1E7